MPSEAAERWFALAKQFPVSPKLRERVLRGSSQTDSVESGQLRQADWRDISAMLVIDQVDDDGALAWAYPATLEPNVADSRAVIIDAERTPVGGAIGVWPTEAAWVPFAALDAIIATLPPTLLSVLRTAQQPEALLDTASGVHRAHADPSPGSGSALGTDELLDALETLREAPRLTVRDDSQPPADISAIALPTIMQVLRVSQPRAMAIRLGKEQLTADETRALAAAVGVTETAIEALRLPLPRELDRELQEPRWRPMIRASAVDGDETAARAQLGYEAFQLAARQTGSGRELWRQRLETVRNLRSR